MRMFMTQLILFFFLLLLVFWERVLLCSSDSPCTCDPPVSAPWTLASWPFIQSDFTFCFFFYLLLLCCCCCFCFCFILCECIGGGCMPLCMCGDQRTTSPLPPHGFCDQTQVFSLGSKCLYRLSPLPSYPCPRMHLNVHFQKKILRVREILSF